MYLVLGGTWSRGVPGLGEYTWSQGVYLVGGYLVPGGTWSGGAPGRGMHLVPGGCTWSRGGGVPGQVHPLWTDRRL